MSLPGRRVRIGLAVGPGEVTGLVEGKRTRPERVVAGVADEGVREGWLETALGELASRLASTQGRSLRGAEAFVALLPPLADVRLVTLPPLRQSEMEAVVRRDAARHFIGAEGPRVVGVAPRRRGGSGLAPVLAAAAPVTLLESLRRAVAATGWRLGSVVPSHAAWLGAVPEGRAEGLVVAVLDGTAHVVRLEEGAPVSLRRVPIVLLDELSEVAGSAGSAPAMVLGEAPEAGAVAEVLGRSGWTVPEPTEPATGAPEAAARHARGARPELVPPSLAAERADRVRRSAWRMAGAAALLVVAAAGAHLWGAKRELAAVRALRAEIRDEVAPLVAARDSLEELNARVAAIDDITDRSPRWTRALYELALLLPRDAHLTSLVATGESVEIEVEAGRAGAAIQALRGAESLQGVELLGLVERELEDGETVVERFRVGARLAPPPDPGAADPGTTDGAATDAGGRSP